MLILGLILIGCAPQGSTDGRRGIQSTGSDVVIQWNDAFNHAVVASGTSPGDTSRLGAILHVAIYDAINGIVKSYVPLHEDQTAPNGASAAAAGAQAGHDVLVAIYPKLAATFDSTLAAMIAANTDDPSTIAPGRAWGAQVATDILVWRSTDGRSCSPTAVGTTCPNHFGQTGLGQWRPVPPAPPTAAAAAPQYVNMVTWVLTSHDQFLWAWRGPPAIDSQAFAADVAESENLGDVASTTRTQAQTDDAEFYADNANVHWNRIANAVAQQHPHSLVDNARVFAALNVALADANINVWQSKYKFNFWRPYHSARETTSYNSGVTPSPNYVSLITTPNHQEYGSGHSHVSGAASVILASVYGNNVTFTHTSDTVSPKLTSNTRTSTGFFQVAVEIDNARVWGGIHNRTTCVESHLQGIGIAAYILDNAFGSLQSGRQQNSHDHPQGVIVTGDDHAADEN
jgi:hypothetical protein